MNVVARILRRRRAEAGALQLASPEVKFEIDTETHDPLDVGMYQARPALLMRPAVSQCCCQYSLDLVLCSVSAPFKHCIWGQWLWNGTSLP